MSAETHGLLNMLAVAALAVALAAIILANGAS